MRINRGFNINVRGTIISNVPEPGAWIIHEQLTGNAGHPVPMPSWATDCITGQGIGRKACLAQMHSMYRVVVTYQPAGRFWTLQFWELGIYLMLAVALAAFRVYWIRERVS